MSDTTTVCDNLIVYGTRSECKNADCEIFLAINCVTSCCMFFIVEMKAQTLSICHFGAWNQCFSLDIPIRTWCDMNNSIVWNGQHLQMTFNERQRGRNVVSREFRVRTFILCLLPIFDENQNTWTLHKNYMYKQNRAEQSRTEPKWKQTEKKPNTSDGMGIGMGMGLEIMIVMLICNFKYVYLPNEIMLANNNQQTGNAIMSKFRGRARF